MSAEKKLMLDLPLRVVLTESGISHFISHNKKLVRFRLADNVDESGISFTSFAPLSLQSLIILQELLRNSKLLSKL